MTTAEPPELPGYEYIRELGHGGFADVFLFRQRLPSRQVAVKVLRQTTHSDADRQQFENEANRMAALSTHPCILTIYEVGVSPAGQPYLTMEYCPHDHFGKIARHRPLSIARALEVGIKVAAAVETAHQSEIMHRDIKPANILMTSYGEPALTDFGIAGGADGDGLADSQGVSIPFAPAEVLNGSTSGDKLSDVYSVGATVYALIAGRSPFSTGSPLSEAELMNRVLSAPLPPTGRPDVPPSLERVLANALARDPAKRYNSAAAFGRALQAIEAELNLAQTPLQIPDTLTVGRARRDEEDDDSTRFKAMQRVDPEGPAPAATESRTAGTASPSVPSAGPSRAPVRPRSSPAGFGGSASSEPLEARTVQRSASVVKPDAEPDDAETAADQDDDAGSRRNRIIASLGGAAVLIVVLIFIISKAGNGGGDPAPTSSTSSDTSPIVTASAPQAPTNVRVEREEFGGQLISWSAADSVEGDVYQIRFSAGPDELVDDPPRTSQTELRVDTDDRICVSVTTIRGGRVSDDSREVCTSS